MCTAPSIPKVETPEPPKMAKAVTAAVAEARAQQQKTAAKRTGYNSTILTGGLGLQNQQNKLLGG